MQTGIYMYSLLVAGHEFEVVGGCDVVVATQLAQDSLRHVDHGAVHHREDRRQLRLDALLRKNKNTT